MPTKFSDRAIDQIVGIAADSEIARFSWKDRGIASLGYIKGMAVVYARVGSVASFKADKFVAERLWCVLRLPTRKGCR